MRRKKKILGNNLHYALARCNLSKYNSAYKMVHFFLKLIITFYILPNQMLYLSFILYIKYYVNMNCMGFYFSGPFIVVSKSWKQSISLKGCIKLENLLNLSKAKHQFKMRQGSYIRSSLTQCLKSIYYIYHILEQT